MAYAYWVSATDATTGAPAHVSDVEDAYSVRICDDCSGEGFYLVSPAVDPCMECGGEGYTNYPEGDAGD